MTKLFRGNSFGSGLMSKEVLREKMPSGSSHKLHRSLTAENGFKSDEDSFEDAAEVLPTESCWSVTSMRQSGVSEGMRKSRCNEFTGFGIP